MTGGDAAAVSDGVEARNPRPERTSSRAGLIDAIRRHPVYVFPAVVLIVFAILVASGLSGTSVGALAQPERADDALIVGAPQEIRSDEYSVRTPLILGQIERGFPARIETGIGEQDAAVLYYLPTREWSTLFKPQLWGYFVLPPAQAFAFDWWGNFVILLLGLYAFLIVMLRDWRWATAGALALGSAPFFQWWMLPSVLGPVGFTAGGFAALLVAVREPKQARRRYAWAALAGALFACNLLHLYPPFQIPVAMIFGVMSLALALWWARRGDLVWRAALGACIVAGGVAVAVAGTFVLEHRAAYEAMAATVYPGDRRVSGGDGMPWQYFVNSWFSWLPAVRSSEMVPFVVRNASEDSSFPMVGLFLIPFLPFLWGRIAAVGSRFRGAIMGLLGLLGLFGLHIFLRLPMILGRVTLLDRVTTKRLILGVGLASLLLFVVVGVAIARASISGRRRLMVGAGYTALTILYVLSLARDLRIAGAPLRLLEVIAVVMVAGAVAATFLWRPLVSVVLLAGFGIITAFPVNPLYRGLAPLRDPELAAQLRNAAAGNTDAGWIAISPDMQDFITANGFADRSGVDLYPDAEAWSVLDPDRQYEEAWNRYAHVRWEFDPAVPDPSIALTYVDAITVRISPCDPALEALNIRYVVSPEPIAGSCFDSVATVRSPKGQQQIISVRR